MKKYIRFYVLFLILVFAISIFIIVVGDNLSRQIDLKIRQMTTNIINGNVKSGEVFVQYNGKIIIKNISVFRPNGEILFVPSTEIRVNWLKSIFFRRFVINNIVFNSPKMNLFMEGKNLNIINLFSVEHKNKNGDTTSIKTGEFKSGVEALINGMEIKNGEIKLSVNDFKKTYENVNISVNLRLAKDGLLLNLKHFELISDSVKLKANHGRMELSKSKMKIEDVRLNSDRINLTFNGVMDLNTSEFKFKTTGEGELSFINYFTPDSIPITGQCSYALNGSVFNGKYKITGDLLSNYTSYMAYNFTGIAGKILIENDTFIFNHTSAYYKHSKVTGSGYFSFRNAVFYCSLKSDTLILRDLYANASDDINKAEASIKYIDRLRTTFISGIFNDTKVKNRYNIVLHISPSKIIIDTFTVKDSLERFALNGEYSLKENKISLQGKFNKFNIKNMAHLIGDTITGIVNGNMEAQGNLLNPDVKADLSLNKLKFNKYSAGYIDFNTSLSSIFNYPRGNLHVNGTNINLGGMGIEIFNLEGKNIGERFYIDGSIKSDKGKADLLCSILLKDLNNVKMTVDSLSGRFYSSDFFAKKKMTADITKDSFIIENMDLNLLTGGELSGYFHMDKMNMKGKLNISEMDLIALKDLIKDYKIGGIADISISLRGNRENPSFSGAVDIDSLILNKTQFKKFKCDLGYKNKIFTLKDLHFYKGTEYSWIKGYFDVSQRLRGDVKFSLNNVPFNLIPANDFIYVDSGFISLNGSITGDMKSPYFNFTGNADNISFKIPEYGINIQKMIFNVMGKDNRIIVSNILAGTENYGYFKGNSTISYSNGKLQYYRVNAEVNDFAVHYYDFVQGNINGTAYISGDKNQLNLNSNLKIYDTDINISFRNPPVFVSSGGQKSKFKANYNVSLDVGNNVWFRNEDMELEVGGNLNLRNYGSNIFINGKLSTRRGYYYYFDRAFSIREGSIQFTNTNDFNPLISIQSETKISHMNQTNGHYEKENITIHLDASGKAKNPEISIYSVPPKSVIAILSLLNVNLTPDELTKLNIIGASLSEKILNYYLRTKIINNLQKKLGIDIFDIETSLLSQNRYARINVGKYLASNFFVSYSHDIFSQSQDEFRLDYYFRNGINLFGERDYTGKFNFGVGFIYRY